jgi:hypothetical protein
MNNADILSKLAKRFRKNTQGPWQHTYHYSKDGLVVNKWLLRTDVASVKQKGDKRSRADLGGSFVLNVICSKILKSPCLYRGS